MTDTTTPTPPLAPCPFCLGADVRLALHGFVWTVACRACGGVGPWMTTEGFAAAAWNRRAAPPADRPAPAEADSRISGDEARRVLGQMIDAMDHAGVMGAAPGMGTRKHPVAALKGVLARLKFPPPPGG